MAHTYSYEKMAEAHKKPNCVLEVLSNGQGWLYVHCKGCCFVAELESISTKGAVAYDFEPYSDQAVESSAIIITRAVEAYMTRLALAAPKAGA